jgi:hypothetical protein
MKISSIFSAGFREAAVDRDQPEPGADFMNLILGRNVFYNFLSRINR